MLNEVTFVGFKGGEMAPIVPPAKRWPTIFGPKSKPVIWSKIPALVNQHQYSNFCDSCASSKSSWDYTFGINFDVH